MNPTSLFGLQALVILAVFASLLLVIAAPGLPVWIPPIYCGLAVGIFVFVVTKNRKDL